MAKDQGCLLGPDRGPRPEAGERRGVCALIAGPTASGKSPLALRLAHEFGGTVVNADSMQVYGDLRVITARPSADDEARAPHRLYGHVDGATNYSAGHFARDVARLVADPATAWPLIVVGGTGLYLKALTEGLSELPVVPEAVRTAVRADVADRSTADLHADLAARDLAMAERLRPTDRMRIMRALEILAATGRSIASFHDERRPGPLAGRPSAAIFLSPDRDRLRERIDDRFGRMVEGGALDEVAALGRRGLDPMLPVMRAHGVPGLLAHLAGEIPLAEAIRRGRADTRAYAKRQFTWFRHQMPDFRHVRPDEAYDRLAEDLAAHRTMR